MTHIKPPPTHSQPHLFDLLPDKRLTSPGESRSRYGRVVEEIVCALLGLTDIPNSGSHEVVFDAYRDGTYVEIKSLREGSKLPLYEWRRKKDAESGVPLVYVVALHRCVKQTTLGGVWRAMAETITEILVLPSDVVSWLADGEPLRQIVSQGPPGDRQGYKRKGYCEGYRNVPSSLLRSAGYHAPVKRECVIHDLPVSAQVSFHRSLTPWFA